MLVSEREESIYSSISSGLFQIDIFLKNYKPIFAIFTDGKTIFSVLDESYKWTVRWIGRRWALSISTDTLDMLERTGILIWVKETLNLYSI